jgi:hypothetical protein
MSGARGTTDIVADNGARQNATLRINRAHSLE